ncbi:MAG: hypothetical protein COB60_10925 [Flavobacteriaceae bacterium]|nr:MAG: hypothetical protein COB60_10925 [Flavobacteriaceae bacterium]
MSDISKQPFLTLFFRFFFIFLIVVTLIKVVFGLVSDGYESMMNEFFSAANWMQFVKMQLVMSAVYGAFMTGYYKFIKK